MTRTARALVLTLIVGIALAASACDEGGIGMGVPTSGARWGSGTAGPDVLVRGGPVYR
jgi:hypothetical protein